MARARGQQDGEQNRRRASHRPVLQRPSRAQCQTGTIDRHRSEWPAAVVLVTMLRRTSWKLMLVMLVTASSMACQQKRESLRIPKLMSGERANPLVIVGNGAAYGRIMERLRSH
jgi:hypothetical protein